MLNHKIQLSVRDYECDSQAIVNNAVYQNYLEHARHQYLKAIGIDFNQCTKSGLNLVVMRAEIDYKKSLIPSSEFEIETVCEKSSPLKVVFNQTIRLLTGELILKAKIYATGVNKQGKFELPITLISGLN